MSPGSLQLKYFVDFRNKIENPGWLTSEKWIESIRWLYNFYSEVYIVVDGIDEWASYSARQALLVRLLQLSIGPARVLLISRSETVREIHAIDKRDLPSSNSQGTVKITEIGGEDITTDISIHIAWTLENDPKLKRMKLALKEQVKHALSANHGGM